MTQQLATSTLTMESLNTDPVSSLTGGAVAAFDVQSAIQAARLGDDNAFSHLVEHYQGTAQRVAQHILRTEEAAADAVQEALIKAHRAMPRFQEGNFRSWLLRIVTNTCYDHLRRQRRRAAASLDELVDDSGLELPSTNDEEAIDPARLAIRREGMEAILYEIDQLPTWHRNVVLLIDVHGYDYAEAAELLGLPLGTVKSRLSRARSALRDALVARDMMPANLMN
jgi:RNA polymerase sigma-70 factor (ECF subfamily)